MMDKVLFHLTLWFIITKKWLYFTKIGKIIQIISLITFFPIIIIVWTVFLLFLYAYRIIFEDIWFIFNNIIDGIVDLFHNLDNEEHKELWKKVKTTVKEWKEKHETESPQE